MVYCTYWGTMITIKKNAKIMHKKESEILAFLGYNVPEVEDEFL